MQLKYNSHPKAFLIFAVFIAFACSENEVEPLNIEWSITTNDNFIEFYNEANAFVETNLPGVIGGRLEYKLEVNQYFDNAVLNNIVWNNLPKGLVPVVTLNQEMNSLHISIEGIAEKHTKSDSRNNISVRIPVDKTSGNRTTEIEIKDIKILFHDVPCSWKSPVTSKEYLLVFNDEFNRSKIDKKRWRYRSSTQKTTRTIEYNKEGYDIMVEEQASFLQDGNMVLSVYKKEDEPNKIFTGGILTLDKFMPCYGYFETMVSFEDCHGFGHWPAFWLHFLNEDKNTSGTEIDVFEYINSSQSIFQTLHWYINDEHFSSNESFDLSTTSAYNKFALEWTPNELIFYTNDKITRRIKKTENIRAVPNAYQMVYFSMSAGTWGGNVAAPDNKLPASSKFDYCRVYQSKGQDAFYKFGDGERLIEAEDRLGNY